MLTEIVLLGGPAHGMITKFDGDFGKYVVKDENGCDHAYELAMKFEHPRFDGGGLAYTHPSLPHSMANTFLALIEHAVQAEKANELLLRIRTRFSSPAWPMLRQELAEEGNQLCIVIDQILAELELRE